LLLGGPEEGDVDPSSEADDVERLKARPVTTLCITCKSAQEARERQGSAR